MTKDNRKKETNKLCECGCGRPTTIFRGITRRFISGHNGRLQEKRLIIPSSDGYELILAPNHPFVNCDGRVRRHRLIYEEYYKCCLLPWIEIHHKDGNKLNNEINNLEPNTKPNHSRIHKPTVDMSDRVCYYCGSNTTFWDKRGWFIWTWYNGHWECRKCYKKRKYKEKKNK